MARFNNEYILKIKMNPSAHVFCPLGQAWYTLNLNIEMLPDGVIPDYVEVQQWINENLDGKTLSIEDAICNCANYFKTEYTPKQINIDAVVNDAAHFPVIVSV